MLTYEAVIGLEIHAELLTESKMFCACPVVDSTEAAPNSAVCPVCAGMPGTLPVLNERAVEYALRVALALGCEINRTSLFARKNYFYPDLPKGYQISQYEEPLARNGRLTIRVSAGERDIRIRRVHLEEDTGKSTHVQAERALENDGGDEASYSLIDLNRAGGSEAGYSLIDLNRAGIPLLEIVTEPDLHSPEEVGACARALRLLLQYLDVNTGDMQKGVLRIEPNVSVRPAGAEQLGTRTEVKNLNSFRALERAVAFEIDRQTRRLENGERVIQETVGWDEGAQVTVPQRDKEEAHDYRYFPEPDLPPLVIDSSRIDSAQEALPEIPHVRFRRFQAQYGVSEYDAEVLTGSRAVADYFERTAKAAQGVDPKRAVNWITGDLFAILKQTGTAIQAVKPAPEQLAELLVMLSKGEINPSSGRQILFVMVETGRSAGELVIELDLAQVSDITAIDGWVRSVLDENPEILREYREGKTNVSNWLFGQIMRRAKGRANPQIVRTQLAKQLHDIIK